MKENTGSIQVVELAPGKPHIEYEVVSSKKLTFGDDELTINLAARERDEKVVLDICIDSDNGIVIGTGGGARRYAAQVEIPAREYDIIEDGFDDEGNVREYPIPIPFDMSRCTLILWALEV